MIANHRLHMASLLDDRMKRSKARNAAKSNSDSHHIKTYIIEAMLSESSSAEASRKFIERLFPRAGGRATGALVLSVAPEDTVTTIQTIVAGDPVTAYLDFTNPRFWLMHSMSDSTALERLVAHWIDDLPELDRAWFPVGLLDVYARLGTLRGVRLEYNNTWIKGDPFSVNGADVFNMTVRTKHAARVLKTMRSDSGEPRVARLAKVTVESSGSVSDVNYDGKITGHGKSFPDHVSVANNVVEKYAEQVRYVEDHYAIEGLFSGGQITLGGSPLTFILPERIEDLSFFCESMFSAADPFRLWGDPVHVSENFFRVQALDLHSARTLAFELTPDFIRVYLPKGSCGNSILRLYTNLQSRYNALVTLVNGNREPALGF